MANRSIDVPESSAPAALSRIGQRRQVVIPKSVFDALRLNEGDLVEVTTDQGRVSMKPKKPLDADDTLTLEESSKVRHALKQARAGNSRTIRFEATYSRSGGEHGKVSSAVGWAAIACSFPPNTTSKSGCAPDIPSLGKNIPVLTSARPKPPN